MILSFIEALSDEQQNIVISLAEMEQKKALDAQVKSDALLLSNPVKKTGKKKSVIEPVGVIVTKTLTADSVKTLNELTVTATTTLLSTTSTAIPLTTEGVIATVATVPFTSLLSGTPTLTSGLATTPPAVLTETLTESSLVSTTIAITIPNAPPTPRVDTVEPESCREVAESPLVPPIDTPIDWVAVVFFFFF